MKCDLTKVEEPTKLIVLQARLSTSAARLQPELQAVHRYLVSLLGH